MDCAQCIVPFEAYAAVPFAFPINGDFVMLFEAGFQVFYVFFADVLNAEVIDDKGEEDWSDIVFPQARCVGCGSVAVYCEALG